MEEDDNVGIVEESTIVDVSESPAVEDQVSLLNDSSTVAGEGEEEGPTSSAPNTNAETILEKIENDELEEDDNVGIVEESTIVDVSESPAVEDQVSLLNDSSTVAGEGEEEGPTSSAPNTNAETILVNVEEAKHSDRPPLATTPTTTTTTTEEGKESASVVQQQQSNIPSEEACNLCGNSGQLDWSEQVTYEKSSISCGEFGWIFLSDNIAEGSDTCLNLRSKYFDKCCYTKPVGGDGCSLCDTGVEGTWHDIRENVNVKFNGDDDVSCMDLQNKVRTRFEPESDECLKTKEEHFDSCW